jgi:hypothetical protein
MGTYREYSNICGAGHKLPGLSRKRSNGFRFRFQQYPVMIAGKSYCVHFVDAHRNCEEI